MPNSVAYFLLHVIEMHTTGYWSFCSLHHEHWTVPVCVHTCMLVAQVFQFQLWQATLTMLYIHQTCGVWLSSSLFASCCDTTCKYRHLFVGRSLLCKLSPAVAVLATQWYLVAGTFTDSSVHNESQYSFHTTWPSDVVIHAQIRSLTAPKIQTVHVTYYLWFCASNYDLWCYWTVF